MIKECFVTVGATAKFPELIQAILSPGCIKQLTDHGFTNLTVQHGEDGELFTKLMPKDSTLYIRGFDFDKEGIQKHVRKCQARPRVSEKGLVISHAGAGSILDVLRMQVPIIVVPNDTLLDKHQEELADELAGLGYVTKSTTDNLEKTIDKIPRKTVTAWDGSRHSSITTLIDETAGYSGPRPRYPSTIAHSTSSDVKYEEDVRARLD